MFRGKLLVSGGCNLNRPFEILWDYRGFEDKIRRCHVKLLELFRREQLPTFPPKDTGGGRQEQLGWMDIRDKPD